MHLFYNWKLILNITTSIYFPRRTTVLTSYRATLHTILNKISKWFFFSDEDSHAFKEVAIIRHPRLGEYAFGFITSTIILRKSTGAEELCCVYVPTNHLYLGDVFLINSKDIMRPNLSVREGIGKSLNFQLSQVFMFVWYDTIHFLWIFRKDFPENTFSKEKKTYA